MCSTHLLLLAAVLLVSYLFFVVLEIGHIAVLRTQMQPIVIDRVVWSVCLSVSQSVTLVSPLTVCI